MTHMRAIATDLFTQNVDFKAPAPPTVEAEADTVTKVCLYLLCYHCICSLSCLAADIHP
jgi:hypothetical protein